ncbi:MAG: ATP synthase F1 subunit delta [Gemmatimonadales bacterium]|nr:ATP synthase F1 subunit delta [Gemmatimonadales bacterium]
MRDRKVAVRYAGALLTSAKAEGVLNDVAESFAAVLNVLNANKDLGIFLHSPQVRTQEKKELLNKVFSGNIESVLLRFFYLLIDKKRIENILDIGEEFADQVEKDQGVVRARVVTAIELPADLAELLQGKLTNLTGARVILENKIDPAVVGGVCVTLGDKILDGTVRANLDSLRKKLEKAQVR